MTRRILVTSRPTIVAKQDFAPSPRALQQLRNWPRQARPYSRSVVADAVKLLERGAILVHINLHWGQVEWRAANQTIVGRSIEGYPFTVTGVSGDALLRWLRGSSTDEAFPQMDRADRDLLELGYV